MRRLKIFLIIIAVIVLTAIFIFLRLSSLDSLNPVTVDYYNQLRSELVLQGYDDNLLVISTKRPAWYNCILTNFGAAKKSQHLHGNAIDIVVLDVNVDNIIDTNDVDIVYNILNNEIVRDKGGVGTYKSLPAFWDRQMVHFDCRGYRARWHR